ncbi:hypothetical protein UFOVP112_53 [uncultured Caudovirales phage]|uniref:Uncharacterized protein n=1 Tax=uncultured Caudovirales phage TaxID=2100421 RepID=A0A6J5L2T8_9CAUD|nr:hypothetical protein UFOVP112_53 [uncultured Caudovirales phage]
MILYVNGDSHSAGAETANVFCFAEDDPLLWAMGRQPHPDNLKLSYGCSIANKLMAILECDAESASSNTRILRTTQEYLKNNTPDLVIIGWSTWEREEWLHDGVYYQVTSGGSDTVPAELADYYKAWVIAQDSIAREAKMLKWHKEIYKLHLDLEEKKIPHVFFNAYSNFVAIKKGQITTHNQKPGEPIECFDWGDSYVGPYDHDLTYYYWLENKGFKPVNPKSYHHGADAHEAWSEFIFQNYVQKVLTN